MSDDGERVRLERWRLHVAELERMLLVRTAERCYAESLKCRHCNVLLSVRLAYMGDWSAACATCRPAGHSICCPCAACYCGPPGAADALAAPRYIDDSFRVAAAEASVLAWWAKTTPRSS